MVLLLGSCDMPGASWGKVKIPVANMAGYLTDTILSSFLDCRTLILLAGNNMLKKADPVLVPGDETWLV